MATETFDVTGHLADRPTFGAFEEHMLMKMRQPFLARSLIRRTHPSPDLELDHRRAMTLP
jgi:hypothetical protein